LTRLQRAAGRALLAVVGISLIAYLVHGAGAERVGQVLWQARSWLPVIIALELLQLVSDFVTLRTQLGERWRQVPRATWLRSSALAYAMMILLPAGRATGEVARAALIAKHVGAARAATASTQLQVAYVGAIGVLSIIEAAVVGSWLGFRAPLPLLLLANAAIMGGIAAGLLAILWDARIGRWLERIRLRFARRGEGGGDRPPDGARGSLEPADRRLPRAGVVFCLTSRTAQAVQYGVILHAVGGIATPRSALVTHGIELIGATIGDVFPNQIGIVDGAYHTFAAAVGFGDAPARALSIALLARIARLVIASLCILVLVLSRRGTARSASTTQAHVQTRAKPRTGLTRV
jgi:Lysylphosphatidylglycerol synthase TM region